MAGSFSPGDDLDVFTELEECARLLTSAGWVIDNYFISASNPPENYARFLNSRDPRKFIIVPVTGNISFKDPNFGKAREVKDEWKAFCSWANVPLAWDIELGELRSKIADVCVSDGKKKTKKKKIRVVSKSQSYT